MITDEVLSKKFHKNCGMAHENRDTSLASTARERGRPGTRLRVGALLEEGAT